MSELYKKYRPKKLDDLIGQEKQVKVLKGLLQNGFPHALLLTGPSGCGKTTTARILRRLLKCNERTGDFQEINAAMSRGIDMVRDISKHINHTSWKGTSRIWYIDESHSLTSEGQESLLKLLEDPPGHAYFFLATTNPGKLKSTIHTRCTEIRFTPLNDKDMETLVRGVLQKEGVKLADIVVEKVVQISEGSARKALVLLEQAYKLPTEEDQIEAVEKSLAKRQGIEVARLLFDPKKGDWARISEVLNNLEDEPETVRHIILSYAASVLTGKDARKFARAFEIIRAFEVNFYDSKKAGLVAACYDLMKK